MTARVHLVLQGPLDQLRLAWQTGELLLQMVPFGTDPEGQRQSVLLAVQEMLTNVLRHAHGGDDELPVHIDFRVDPTGVEIAIEDEGPEFDPCTAALPEVDGDEMPLEPGGYGILITRMVMDHLEHRRIGNRNLLIMKKFAEVMASAECRTEPGT